MCVRFSRFFGIFAVSVIIFASCFGGIDVSADEVEITKVSAFTGRSFFGDTISATYYKSGSPYSLTFSYLDSFSSPGVGLNVDSSSLISSPSEMAQYDFVVYKALISGDYSAFVDSISFNDFYLRFGDYARGGFALSCRLSDGIQAAANNAVTYPNNYCGSFGGVRANSSASAALADYYGTMYFSPASGMVSLNFRPIYYTFDNGGVMDSLQFQSVPCYTGNNGTELYFIVICPYIGSSMSGEPPAETTTDSSSSGGSVTIINNNTDLTQTNGLISSVISGLQSLGQSILSGIEHIFVPQQGYFDYKIAQVKAKFAWYEDIVDAWTEFKTALNNVSADTPPSITLSLDNRTFFGRPIGSGSGTALVLDWMITYRNTIRNLLTAFMWIFFLWRLYCHIPNIISGSGMEVQKTDEGVAWTIHGKKL